MESASAFLLSSMMSPAIINRYKFITELAGINFCAVNMHILLHDKRKPVRRELSVRSTKGREDAFSCPAVRCAA